MSHSIQYLAHLVQTKNALNRKRRRFYASMSEPRLRRRSNNTNYRSGPLRVYTKKEAMLGYRNAQAEMKAMTKHMRAVRTELNAKFEWSDGGSITTICLEGKRYSEKEMASLAASYKADAILLGD